MRPRSSSSAILLVLTCGVLLLMFTNRALAQSAPQQDATPASAASAPANPAAQTNAQEASPQSEDSVSLAEAARLARANKGTAANAKPTKKYDDDNFPRSTPIVKKNTSESAAANPSIQDLPVDQMKGKVVLLDFWASWCGPCRMVLPKVKQLQSVYSSEDFVVVSVSEDDDEATWRGFVADHGMTWTQRFDGNSALLRKYQVNGLPTYVLLDRDGNEVQRYEGEDPGQSIIERAAPDIKRALETRQSASN
ncbi:MAG TPA: TlpA disulfide reductase family protein [Candidatus Sulfotelmatobacter sp.]|nr:TlpA disulfide reductase family protein [Candidatus Sulfotelmatobacter sp.]